MVGSLLDAKTLVAASTQRPNTRVSAIVYKGVLLTKQRTSAASKSSFFANTFGLVKQTAQESLQDKAPQLGAALAYYTVFSLAPLILVLLSLVGVIFRHDAAGAWNKITQQMSYFLDPSAVQVVQSIAQKASQPGKSTLATIIGVALALFGASGVSTVFENLEGFPMDWQTNPKGFIKFVRDHQCPSFLEYGEYPFFSADEIKKALSIKDAFTQMLDQLQ